MAEINWAELIDLNIKEKTKLFLHDLREKIVDELSSKNVTGYGPSNASGALLESVIVHETENGGFIEINSYAYQLIYGRAPGRRPPVDVIQTWLDEKGLGLNAYAVATKIAKQGTSVFVKYNPGESGLFRDSLSEENINSFLDSLSNSLASNISSNLLSNLEKK